MAIAVTPVLPPRSLLAAEIRGLKAAEVLAIFPLTLNMEAHEDSVNQGFSAKYWALVLGIEPDTPLLWVIPSEFRGLPAAEWLIRTP
jgi:hypothetical protein